MTYHQSIHIDAPVTTVFDFFRDPNNWALEASGGVSFKGVYLTQEGLGTHYTWVARIAGISLTGFNVFTEFIPNQRITDRSSSSLEGTWTYSFEPDGSGTRLTRREPGEFLLATTTAGGAAGPGDGEDAWTAVREAQSATRG